ncbi:phage Gp37/Gp68 family protein [Azospirillum canadense]|uniref:phage Gp37/Gp68 family protein n=1 Tax=Azospirillum canadense TaxID=403962 RepID=UPI002227046F|nr:phage Gp37/Gp68 family protein [Azospirillum canadense]MCW2242236.1 protein gp37 [Azospirillum canadense]
MAENSAIEWTDHTFNPWIGCTKVSLACDNCYAETERAVTCLGVTWGVGQPRHRTSASTWKQPLAWNRKAAKLGIRYRVFCASLADVFDAEVPDEWRLDLFRMIVQTPHLDWLLLTKRPKVAQNFLSSFAMAPGKSGFLTHNGDKPKGWGGTGEIIHGVGQEQIWPLPNVWLGATVESQAMAETRIPHLLATPAAVRFVSMEPLLGPVAMRPWLQGIPADAALSSYRRVDWVIAGGESGVHARPSHPDWFRSLRDECIATGVPFLMKQWGEWVPRGPADWGYPSVDGVPRIRLTNEGQNGHFLNAEGGNPVWMNRAGKRVAGRLLDGVLHDAYPTA